MRTFAIAFPRGTMFGPEGPSVRLRSGREAEGSLIRENRARSIRERVGISDRTWRRHVAEFVEQYVAHRCANGDICLFTHAMPAACPSCHEELTFDRVPEAHRRPRSDRDREGRFASGQKVSALPVRSRPVPGRKLSALPAETWPPPSTDEPHRESLFRGVEVGRAAAAVVHNDGDGAPTDPAAWPCPACGAMSGSGHGMRCMTGVRERFLGGR
jgi:hypothetical protein